MELADRILPDLLSRGGNTDAGRVLAAWDRHTDVDSRGAVLFQLFVDRYFSAAAGGMDGKLRVKYDPERPLELRSRPCRCRRGGGGALGGRRRVRQAVRRARREVGRRVSFRKRERRSPRQWRSRRLGALPDDRVYAALLDEGRGEGDRYYAASGETIVCAIEFSRNQRAQCLLGYGNATQPGSPHLEDQLPFMVQKKLLPVHREKKDIEADLELRERF